MFYLVQKNVFKEENYDNLIDALDRLKLSYEIVNVLPFVDELDYQTKRTDIFPFGLLKMARISNDKKWKPGSQMNTNYDFLVYRNHYKENLLNFDSKIIKFNQDFYQKERFFARPTKDTKVFSGQVFDLFEWRKFVTETLNNGHSTILNDETEVQINSTRN